MKKLLLYTLIMSGLISSCARDTDLNFVGMAQISFNQWIQNNAPEASPFVDINGVAHNDIFILYNARGPVVADEQKIKPYEWCYIDYTGYTLDGTIFATRRSLPSHIAGKWVNTTHWCNDFVQLYPDNLTLAPAIQQVVQTLNPGDSVRVWMAATQAYISPISVNQGYSGETTKYIGFPAYMDLKMYSVVKNPYTAEFDTVNLFAKNKWGMSINDTIHKGLYMKTIVPNPNGASLTKDSIVAFYTTRRFLDGFLISTNDEKIAKQEERYDPNLDQNDNTAYGPKIQKLDYSTTLPPFVLEILLKMRKGETADAITVSERTEFGYQGNFSNKPQILPYQPIKYTFHIKDTVIFNPGT